jgi:hypothetical protein
MTALGGREVEATVFAVSGYTAGLPRLQPDQTGGQDGGDLIEAFGGGHVGRMESVVHDAIREGVMPRTIGRIVPTRNLRTGDHGRLAAGGTLHPVRVMELILAHDVEQRLHGTSKTEEPMTNPLTANPDWGFFGTIRHHADPVAAWALALPPITRATGRPDAAARDFLDSTQGRHFADDVTNGLAIGKTLAAAIDTAVTRWMGWRISRQTERDTGIPRGLPYLTGFVTHHEIMADARD